ncbi:hypothetical protein [Sinosporangium siamense]|nr:hypothetical protein [Sinosporangium siamense]
MADASRKARFKLASGKLNDQAGPKPDTTGKVKKTLAANSAHVARLLTGASYPPA